ncbi:MAG: branched-chain amino acid ABC transporter permease [Burkholderiales bacterium]|mgnify:CR=1 FL=1
MRDARRAFPVVFLGLLALVPVVAHLTGEPYYLTVFSRIMVFGLAALGLNLILGFGGLVSFGHALYLGIGAYAVGILSAHGVTSGFAHLGAALAVGAVAALLIGLVCLRTSGMAFIMITLAFAQMFYFLAVGLRQYGGDDGLSIPARSAFGPLALQDATVLYYVIFALLAATLYVLHRVVHARFGMVLQGCRENERRMIALGFPTLRYKLAAYVASALICVLAGVLLANLTQYASPAYMQWVVSGDLIVMILFGGMGTLLGPVVGAAAIIAIEDVLTAFRLGLPWGIDQVVNAHWMAILGALIIVVVLTLKQGLYGWLVHRAARAG